MIVYVPVYDNGKKVAAIDTEKARYFHTPGYSATVLYFSTFYNGEYLATDEAGAVAYWQRDYKTMEKYAIEPTDSRIKWAAGRR